MCIVMVFYKLRTSRTTSIVKIICCKYSFQHITTLLRNFALFPDRSAENPHSVMYKVKKAAEGKGQVQAGT